VSRELFTRVTRQTRALASASVAAVALVIGCARARTNARSDSQPANEARALVLARRVVQVDTEAGEPMIVEHPDGTLFVVGMGGPWSSDSEYYSHKLHFDSLTRDRLWKSRDRGASWSSVALDSTAHGMPGNSDVDLAVARDGTLYIASMTWDGRAGEGRRIVIGVSHDAGAAWSWTVLSDHRFDDRPWVVVAPDGSAHVIWNNGHGVQHVASHDGGKTWSAPTLVHDRGGSSHLAVGPRGELAVRVIPWSASHNYLAPGVDLIAVSTDGGTTWKTQPAPGQRDWGTWASGAAHSAPSDSVQAFTGNRATNRCCSNMIIPRWIEPVAWDGEGRLYSLWTDTTGVWLARSADRGVRWSKWRIAESHAQYARDHSPVFDSWVALANRLHHGVYFPYLVARGDGDLAATWHVSDGDSIHWQAARIAIRHDASAPHVTVSPLLELDTFDWGDSTHAAGLVHVPAGEYLGVTFLRDGGIGVITPLQVALTGPVGFTYWRFEVR
jgi:hypothetical protein